MNYLALFSITTLLSAVLTLGIKVLASRWGIVDDPAVAPERKHQKSPIPLLGGFAIYLTIVVMVWWLMPELIGGYLLPKHLGGILLAGLIIMIGGAVDDKFRLSPIPQLIAPTLAIAVIIISGIGIEYIGNPLGGVIYLDSWKFTLFTYNELPYQITLLADLFTIVWLYGAMYTTKLLDGVDGLVSGITVIGSIILFALSISSTVNQPETATLALMVAGACSGFLLWNIAPAKIYLGEGGSLFVGFMLGVLAILSGAKIATALLILGLPIIDIAWVMIQRKWVEGRSIFSGDTLHLHYQLQQFGWSQRKVVLLFYIITASFGVSTLATSSTGKLLTLSLLVVVSIALLSIVFVRAKQLRIKQ